MCGIAGYRGKGDETALARMARSLSHRGPDDTGTWCQGELGFAHARLAVVDLTQGGHQPMHSALGTTIVFNGEIFNYKELREELKALGRALKSESDTEVIVELYDAFGEKSFEKLVGQFAFALYDQKSEALYLVRDRFGEKPLYYAEIDGTLIFGSEPKAIFAHGLLPRAIDPEAPATYLTYDAVLTPQSAYAQMRKVEAASYITFEKDGSAKTSSYWDPAQVPDLHPSFEEAKEKLDALLLQSVSSQMVADVPVGVFLSGGLDSSLVAYYAGQGRAEPIHTFSLGFDDHSYDESAYARRVAEHLGTEHHEYRVTAAEVRDVLGEIIKKLDEPIADPAILPNYMLSRFAREHVTVALGGDAGDELFAGYQTFTAEKLLGWYTLLPKFVRTQIVEPLVRNLPVSHAYFSLDFKAKQFLRGADVPRAYAHQAWLESFSPEEEREILTPRYLAHRAKNPYARIDDYLKQVEGKDEHFKNSYIYLRTYMQDDILAKVDRASMCHSLEVRAPFLDVRVAEYALGLPWNFKYRGFEGKYILKKLMEGRLPHEIIYRKKHGFGLPVGSWFQNEWREFLKESLSRERVLRAGVFVPEVVERLIAEHQAGTHNHRKKLWSLLVFHLWYDAWIA